MEDEFVKNCPLCFRKPEIEQYTKDGNRWYEVCCQNESHAVCVYHHTRPAAIRRWNNGVAREPVAEMIEENK